MYRVKSRRVVWHLHDDCDNEIRWRRYEKLCWAIITKSRVGLPTRRGDFMEVEEC